MVYSEFFLYNSIQHICDFHWDYIHLEENLFCYVHVVKQFESL